MVFEDFYDEFFNARRSLEDPYSKITISKSEYGQLREIAEKYETLVKKFKDIEAKKSELHRQLEEMRDDGRKLKDLEEKTEKYLNSLVRVQADFENYKKSNHRENERYKMRIKEEILKKLIKHYEDLQRALKILETLENDEHVKKGFEMIIKNFEKFLEEEGVREMKCEGQKFDPYKHEALMVEASDNLPENTIIEELDKGYYFNNTILKPAGVKISKLKFNIKN
ncbi:MAG: nucleotide exchange factor GrpE [Promethearchaeota archaeon]|jgi:molecular chaperone GrpE